MFQQQKRRRKNVKKSCPKLSKMWKVLKTIPWLTNLYHRNHPQQYFLVFLICLSIYLSIFVLIWILRELRELCAKFEKILGQNRWRNKLSKLATFDPSFQLSHSAVTHWPWDIFFPADSYKCYPSQITIHHQLCKSRQRKVKVVLGRARVKG